MHAYATELKNLINRKRRRRRRNKWIRVERRRRNWKERKGGGRKDDGEKKWIFDKILLYVCEHVSLDPLCQLISQNWISQEIQGRADLDISRWKKFIDMYMYIYISQKVLSIFFLFFFFIVLYNSLTFPSFCFLEMFCFRG